MKKKKPEYYVWHNIYFKMDSIGRLKIHHHNHDLLYKYNAIYQFNLKFRVYKIRKNNYAIKADYEGKDFWFDIFYFKKSELKKTDFFEIFK